eukprot:gene5135-6998_t
MDKAKIYVHDSNATTPQQQRSMKTKKRPYPNRELDPSFSDKETEIEDVHKKRPKRRGKKAEHFATKQQERQVLYTSSAEGARDVLWNTIRIVEHMVHVNSISHGDATAISNFALEACGLNTSKQKLPVVDVPGTPVFVVLAGSYKRCLELRAELASIANGPVVKLFAKHMKQSDQEKLLKSKAVSCAVGTPARVHSLLDTEALHLKSPCVLALDVSWQDVKKRTLLELDDVRHAIAELFRVHLLPKITQTGWPKIAMF